MSKLIFIFIFFQISFAFALSKKGAFQSTKIGFIQQNYTGTDKQSFSSGSPGYGAELSIDSGGQYFRYFFKTRIMNSIGSQNFIKSGTTYFSKYDYTSIEPELGAAFFPVARKDKGVNIYLWGLGNVSYNNLSIASPPAGSGVNTKAQEFGTGYGAGLGVELIAFTTRGGKRLLIYSEVGFRDSRAPLAGLNNFEISGMTASFGFGF
ncbi:hypothetical protein K2P97_01390 [bacterium]|nr:hypothetical protein [bacterium]